MTYVNRRHDEQQSFIRTALLAEAMRRIRETLDTTLRRAA